MLYPSSGRGSGSTVPLMRIWQGRPVAMDDGRNLRPAQEIRQVLREPDAHSVPPLEAVQTVVSVKRHDITRK
jgi:hypothetical protein